MLDFLKELQVWLVDFVGVLLVEVLGFVVETLVNRDHSFVARRLEAVLQAGLVLVVVAVQGVRGLPSC